MSASTAAGKKRKKTSKPAASNSAVSNILPPLTAPAAPAPATRAPPLSAIAARRAAAAALAAASRPPTPPPAEDAAQDVIAGDMAPEDDVRAQELINAAAASDDDDGAPQDAGGFFAFGSGESSDRGSSSSDEEEVTLKMDGETINLGTVPRPGKGSRRQAKAAGKGKARELGRISKLGSADEVEDVEGEEEHMDVDTPSRPSYASTSGTPSVAEGRVPKKRKGYQQGGSGYQGAMSAFLPTLGQNVLRLDADRLKDVFSDVADGENACIVLLQSDENIVFSGACTLFPLLSSVSVFGASLPPAATSPPAGHAIFAPTCHPLPVVEPLPSSAAASPYLSLLGVDPAMLEGYACAFLVRERRTGLGQMAQAVGGLFDGVWEGDSAGWGVRGFFPILSQTSFTAYTIPLSWESALSSAIPLPSEAPPSAATSTSAYEITFDSPASSPASLPSPSSDKEDDSFGPFTALLKGPKRSGKSGLSRALVNRLLRKYEKVAYLETDLGQSEFGPEGSVSLVVLDRPLLGPSFTHPAIPFRAHYFGSPSPRNDPSRYLALISDLLSAYRLSVQYPPYASTHGAVRDSSSASADARNAAVVPLVINTQGWVKGLGMDLLVRIEDEAEVTDVFEFEVASGGEEWEDGGWEASIPLEGGWGRAYVPVEEQDYSAYGQPMRPGPRKHHLSPVGGTPLAARWTAADLRLLSLITYFHCRFPPAFPSSFDASVAQASPLGESWDFSTPLVALRPWAVDWTQAFRQIHLVGAGAEDVVSSLVWEALAVGLVALVAPDEDSPLYGRREPHQTVPYVQGQPAPNPSSSRFLGLAIVRSIPGDAPLYDKTVHLLTPLPVQLLPQATLVVKGETEVPLVAMLDWRADADYQGGIGGVEREKVPFIEWVGKDGGVGVIGGGRRTVRRNVGRRQG